ncbi:MAG: amidohydrolase family protein [Longimicrobiales bacterium]
MNRSGVCRSLPLFGLLGTMALPGTPLAAQDDASEAWDVTQARGQTRDIDFTTEVGTWMSVDLSPDGAWIAFDLLGHVYRVPAAGGDAELLSRDAGVSVNYHPRYSPDGGTLAFVSDRGGQSNLWVMDADGGNPRAVFTSQTARVVEPVWTPDGDYIVVRRQNLGEGGGGSGLWMYHRDGGQGVELVSSSDEGGAAWPSVSRDGRYLYFHVFDGGAGLAGRDALAGQWQVRRKDLETGEVVSVSSGEAAQQIRGSSGSAYAPEVSPDGRWLAFARRIPNGTISFKGHRFGPRTALWLRDLRTGAERLLMDPVTQDNAEGIKTLRIMPGYDWSDDGASLILSQGGKIRRLDVASGEVTTIPFRARVQRTASEQSRADFRIDDEPFRSRFLRWYTASPDGRRLAFQAVGRIWIQDLPDGTPSRLTGAGFAPFEYAPSWSPDGTRLAFTTWDDAVGGHVWTMAAGGGTPQRVTGDDEAREYLHPTWSPDGTRLVVTRGLGAPERGRGIAWNPYWEIVELPARGGTGRVVTVVETRGGGRSQVARASWGPDGRIFFPDRIPDPDGSGTASGLVSVRPDGSDRRVHLTLPYADEIALSPTGEWVAFQEGDNVYLAPFPYRATGGRPLALTKGSGRVPVTQLTTEGGLYPSWRDASTLDFGSGPHFYSHRPADQSTDSVDITLMVDRRIPTGRVAYTGARIITMAGDEVLENATLVTDGSRIACVGACDTAGADRVIDASGATIMPGIVDMHAHHYRENRGIQPQHDFEQAVYLAYGVTANLDNSMWSQIVFTAGELIRAGDLVGPRTFSTGDPLYRGDGGRQNELTSYEVAEQNVNRLADWGATGIKQYLQPRREQRQWVSHAARKRNLMVTSEGSDLPYNIGMILDGQTAFEHPMSYTPLHDDAARFFGRTRAVYSPTFVVGGPGPWNEEYFFQETDVWRDERLQLWMPWRQVLPQTRRRMWRPETDYSYPMIAQGMADVIEHGGGGAIGSHGQAHGIGSHWEIWMVEPAMGAHGALRVGTLEGARFLGADDDLGSLEVGKLADLLILDRNPLDDIRNTTSIRYVVQGGIVRDGTTLDEVWPTVRPYGLRWWQDDEMWRESDRPVGIWDVRR